MTRLARRTLSASIILAMAAGLLLFAPAQAGATAGPTSHATAPAPQRIDPSELRGLLDQIVAAGAPGAAALVRDEHASSRPPAAWPTCAPAGRCGPG